MNKFTRLFNLKSKFKIYEETVNYIYYIESDLMDLKKFLDDNNIEICNELISFIMNDLEQIQISVARQHCLSSRIKVKNG